MTLGKPNTQVCAIRRNPDNGNLFVLPREFGCDLLDAKRKAHDTARLTGAGWDHANKVVRFAEIIITITEVE